MLQIKHMKRINHSFSTISFRNIFSVLLCLFWCTNFTTEVYYVFFIPIPILLFVWICINNYRVPLLALEDKIALSFILVWLYGVIIGFIRGNQTNYIIANFAGMVCYLSYFCFSYFKCNIHTLNRILLWSGLIISLYAILKLFSYIYGISIPFIDSDVGTSSTGQLRVYFTTLSISYTLLGASFYSFTHKDSSSSSFLNIKIFSFICMVLTIAVFFFVSSSKGFLLGAAILIIIIGLGEHVVNLFHGKLNSNLLLLLLLLFIIVFFLYYYEYFSIVDMMFDKEDASNSTRYDQLVYLLDDCSWIGKGVGAVVPGIVRSEDGPYGFELTYINLVHKFGIFSLILFVNWAYMFVVLIKMILRRQHRLNAIIALSALGYLFPSIGNPMLMHPSLVVLNCLSLYYMKILREQTPLMK